MQIKAEELARAEAELMEAELAAAAAVEVAEEAVHQLKASRAAEEARQRKEAEEVEHAAGEEAAEQDGTGERDQDDQQAEGNAPEDKNEHEFQQEEDVQPCGNVKSDETANSGDSVAYLQEEKAEKADRSGAAGEEDTVQQTEGDAEGNDATECQDHDDEGPENRLDDADALPEEQQTDPELTTHKVFQEVHVVHDSHETFATDTDSDHWPRFIYSVDTGDWDTGLGCVVRADGQRLGHDDLEVSRVLTARASVPLKDSEELISNVISLAPSGHVGQGNSRHFSPFLLVALPHCAPRLHPGREPVVRMRPLEGGRWRDLDTHDVTFDDIREHKFVQCSLRQPGALCVVLRLKREDVPLTARHGGRFLASADSRVTLTWTPHTVNTTANISVAVQHLDQNVVSELRTRTDMDCGHLMSSSPIVHCRSQGPALLKPVVFMLPCPPNPAARPPNPAARPNRPATSVARQDRVADRVDAGPDQRPATARPLLTATRKTEEVVEEEVHVLWRQDRGTWSKMTDVNFLHSNKKDLVLFHMRDVVHRLLVLRTRAGLPPSTVERTAAALEHLSGHHAVHLVMRQHAHLPHQVVLTYTLPPNLERTLRTLAEEGYSQGPPPTGQVKLREGQLLEISFRGNLKPRDDSEFVPLCAFHNSLPFRAQFSVTEIDEFAQKGFASYRGFVQFTTTYTAPFRRSNSATGMALNGDGDCTRPLPCFVSGKHLVAELLASLPKPEPTTPRPLTTAPVTLRSYGPVTNELLRHVAQQLAADDWRRLVPMLNIRRTRLQAILRQNMTTPPWLPVYDVLLTWSKRLPQSFDRVEMLCAALMAVGRSDLVEEVRDKDYNFRQNQAMSAREALLNKAFVRIAKHEKAVSQWRRLAVFLGLSEEQVKVIADSTSSARERCIQSLQRWRNNLDDSGEAVATVTVLSHKLRLCRYRALARDIESIR
ncbi:death domain-containing protein 1-like isoform X2 [Babylonia areolata]